MSLLVQEKVEQAAGILDELNVDVWLTFVRETSAGGDPVLPLIYGDAGLTWQSALILARTGERIAIVGRYELEAARSVGAYPTVIAYDQSIRERLDPQRIALNYSTNDVLADGLSYGLYQVLMGYLEGTPFAGRIVSAETIIGKLRGRKTPGEIARIRAAIETTGRIYERTAAGHERDRDRGVHGGPGGGGGPGAGLARRSLPDGQRRAGLAAGPCGAHRADHPAGPAPAL